MECSLLRGCSFSMGFSADSVILGLDLTLYGGPIKAGASNKLLSQYLFLRVIMRFIIWEKSF